MPDSGMSGPSQPEVPVRVVNHYRPSDNTMTVWDHYFVALVTSSAMGGPHMVEIAARLADQMIEERQERGLE